LLTLLSSQAIRAIQRKRTAGATQVHSSLNDCAILLAFIGLYAIYSRKVRTVLYVVVMLISLAAAAAVD